MANLSGQPSPSKDAGKPGVLFRKTGENFIVLEGLRPIPYSEAFQ